MPVQWVLNPIVLENGIYRPKVATLLDPGRLVRQIEDFDEETGASLGFVATRPTYSHASVAAGGPGEALSFVRGVDLGPLALAPDIECLLAIDESLNKTPRSSGTSTRQACDDAMDARSIARGHLTDDMPWWQFLQTIGRHIQSGWPGPYGTWVGP